MTEDWLAERLAGSPEPLRSGLESAIAGLDSSADLSAELMAAACRVLDDIRDRLEERDAAFDLLVADGLLTLACEAAGVSDPENLAERCRAMGPGGELGQMAERWAGRK